MGAEYFVEMYAANPDPWGFEGLWYERRKYALTLASLPRERYRRAFEPGCSFGVLSEKLAARCESLLCFELIADVAERARRRLAGLAHVEVRALAIPESWPEESLDLIVLSEVAYYLGESGVEDVVDAIARTLEPRGHVVTVHYRGETNYPLSGDAVHAALGRRLQPFAKTVASWLEERFRIDVFEREPP